MNRYSIIGDLLLIFFIFLVLYSGFKIDLSTKNIYESSVATRMRVEEMRDDMNRLLNIAENAPKLERKIDELSQMVLELRDR